MTRILMVRHGDTELDSTTRYWGKSDVKLSPQGFRQAERLSKRLAGEKLDVIYSSDLLRARATAQIISSRHAVPVTDCPELREVNFGELEGLTFAEISGRYPKVASLWLQRSSGLEYPGGESRNGFIQRVGGFLGRLGKHAPEDIILVVAHSGVIRTLICQLLKVKIEFRWQLRCDLASLSAVETYAGGAVLTLLNDVSHLRCEGDLPHPAGQEMNPEKKGFAPIS